MTRSNSAAALNVENLEARDVPAVVVDGAYPAAALMAGTPPTPNGGTVSIREVAIAMNDPNVLNQAATAFENITKSATANDNLTLTNNGGTLTINNSDGVFVRFVVGGVTTLYDAGTSLTIQNVTGIGVSTQLGGNNTIADKTTFLPVTVSDGPGTDTVTLAGTPINPVVLQFLMQSSAAGGINPALVPLLGQLLGPAKTVTGGTGNLTATVTGFAFGDTITGGSGNNLITGPAFGIFNTLKGGSGNNTIIGGFGSDIIIGGAGAGGFDQLAGFGGKDVYVVSGLRFAFVFNQAGDTVFGADNLVTLSTPIK
jgi:Ca2+-binding RTX toxin-like protein